jgi:conjugal transfer pilus assembly protein TraE
MILPKKIASLDAALEEIRFLRLALLLGLVLLAAVLFAAVVFAPRERTVLVPPEIHHSFWVEDSHVSSQYLEEMGVFVARSYLDLTPDNLDFNMHTLLRYASPALYGDLQRELMSAKTRLIADNAATSMSIKEVRSDPVHSRVVVIGTLSTRIAGREVATVAKYMLVEFTYSGGVIQIRNIRETSHDDPFGDKPSH